MGRILERSNLAGIAETPISLLGACQGKFIALRNQNLHMLCRRYVELLGHSELHGVLNARLLALPLA